MSHLNSKIVAGGLTACAVFSLAVTAAAAAPPRTAAGAEAVAAAGSLMIGDFEDKAVQSQQYGTLILRHGREFGWGWSMTTDQRVGGNSRASIALIHPGADGTRGALRVSGEIKPGFPYGPWAGAIWFPGRQPMQPADLSAEHELVFWARGTSGSYNLMLDAGAPGGIPLYAHFVISPQWTEYRIPLASSFPDADWKHVYYLAFSAGNQGRFQFDLDQVSLR